MFSEARVNHSALASDSSKSTEVTGGGSGIARSQVHSRLSFSFNTRRSGMERSRAASKDMAVTVQVGGSGIKASGPDGPRHSHGHIRRLHSTPSPTPFIPRKTTRTPAEITHIPPSPAPSPSSSTPSFTTCTIDDPGQEGPIQDASLER